MPIQLYNTLTRQKEPFTPVKEGSASIYACGPTVYWYAHIGNLRSFLFADLLNRTLKASGLDVALIMNITDVGHLTDDANDGEDKMLVAMRREWTPAYDIAEFYTQAFMGDIKRLNILPANTYPKATEHIQEQIDMIKKLEANGFTYTTSDGVYCDTSKLDNYGQLSGQKAEEKQAGARVDMGEKKNATDFALWKLSPTDAQRDMEWESPWGKGFPGWHIECSAMSQKYLGVPFDIHTGGVDHIAVHHENELAQTQGAEGVQQANIWMHGEFLTVNDGKMSKSLGNLYTIDDLVEKGFDPLDYRYLVLGAHYRTKLNFTFEALEAAKNARRKLVTTVRSWDPATEASSDHLDRFMAAMQDDLASPQALAIMWELIDADLPTATKSATLLKMDEILGLNLAQVIATPIEIPSNIQSLMDERQAARDNKDWARSDELRDQIKALGYTIEDTPQGQVAQSV